MHIPKLREGSYFPSLLEPRRRSEQALLSVIQQAYPLDHPGGSLDAGTTAHEPSHRGLVRQAVADLVDAIALVRRHLWLASEGFSLSDAEPDIWKVPRAQYHRLIDSLAYAA